MWGLHPRPMSCCCCYAIIETFLFKDIEKIILLKCFNAAHILQMHEMKSLCQLPHFSSTAIVWVTLVVRLWESGCLCSCIHQLASSQPSRHLSLSLWPGSSYRSRHPPSVSVLAFKPISSLTPAPLLPSHSISLSFGKIQLSSLNELNSSYYPSISAPNIWWVSAD